MNSRVSPPIGSGPREPTIGDGAALEVESTKSTPSRERTESHAGGGSATVWVVDDDAAVLRTISKLLEVTGRRVETFASAAEFLAAYRPDRAGCLVLDVRMPGMSGLALQQRLATDEIAIPILILTGFGDVPVAVQAMRQGAFDFIEKPFSGQLLIDRIEAALVEDARRRRTRTTRESVRRCRALLTPRERQVMDLVVQGKPNKLVGAALNLSPKTVEVHRANVMKKMEAGSLAELVRMSLTLGEEDQEATA